MIRHLMTVHIVLYAGVLGLFGALIWTVVRDAGVGRVSAPLWTALGGSVLQMIGETWHAYTHLRLAPDAAIPGILAFAGLAIAAAALFAEWRKARETRARYIERHAA